MKICVIIPNYNGAKLLEKNLPRVVLALENYNSEIIIVDDASMPEEQTKLAGIVRSTRESHKISIQTILQKENKGFSTTVNTGAFSTDAEYLLFLNSDAAPKKDFIKPLLSNFINNPKLFGIGCMDESVEGTKTVLRGRGIAHWKRGFLVHSRGEVDKKDTFWISGGSSMIKRSHFIKLGGFDNIYNPFYWEDIDLSYRARKSGLTVLFEPKSVVIHEHAKGAIKKHYDESDVKIIAYRNQIIFVWKNITDLNLLLSNFIWMPYYMLRAIITFDGAFLFGFFLAVLKLPAIIVRRQKQKKTAAKRDSEIIK